MARVGYCPFPGLCRDRENSVATKFILGLCRNMASCFAIGLAGLGMETVPWRSHDLACARQVCARGKDACMTVQCARATELTISVSRQKNFCHDRARSWDEVPMSRPILRFVATWSPGVLGRLGRDGIFVSR